MEFFDFLCDFISPSFLNKKSQTYLYSNQQSGCYKSWIFYAFSYKDKKVQKAIKKIKIYKDRKLEEFFSEILYEQNNELLSEKEMFSELPNTIIIPIPAHKNRNFNQSNRLAKRLQRKIKKSKISSKNLYKRKKTKKQALLVNKSMRFKNIKNSFALKNPQEIKNKNIILVDDICTSGATLEEAKRVLIKAGAREIIAFVIAH